MATYAASIGGVALRATRLGPNGAPLVGANSAYVQTSSFISLSFTPELEEGDEFTQKGANGEVCATFKMPDTLKRVNLELAICDPDPEFTHLVSGGTLLTVTPGGGGTPETVGWAAQETGIDALPDGIALEVWTNAITDGKRDNTYPYYHFIFPFVNLRPSGDRVIANEIMAQTFSGSGVGNIGFGEGPDGSWEFPAVTNRAYAYARTDTAPATRGYQAVTP